MALIKLDPGFRARIEATIARLQREGLSFTYEPINAVSAEIFVKTAGGTRTPSAAGSTWERFIKVAQAKRLHARVGWCGL